MSLHGSFFVGAEGLEPPAQYCMHPHWQPRHITRLYERVSPRKGHSVAVDAVACHLAEATFWILNKKEPYREPTRPQALPKQAQARGFSVSLRYVL